MLATALMVAGVAVGQEGPTMGWSSWNTFGVNISENIIKGQADAMVSKGLLEVGFDHINIDDGYFGGRDAEDGHLLIHATRFPNGLKPVADYIHEKGLKAGIYSDAGRNTCGSMFNGDVTGKGVGLYGHDQQDAGPFGTRRARTLHRYCAGYQEYRTYRCAHECLPLGLSWHVG